MATVTRAPIETTDAEHLNSANAGSYTIVIAYLSAPPETPQDFQTYVVKPTGTGAFAGHDNEYAYYEMGDWNFWGAQSGDTIKCQTVGEASDNKVLTFTGAAWVIPANHAEIDEDILTPNTADYIQGTDLTRMMKAQVATDIYRIAGVDGVVTGIKVTVFSKVTGEIQFPETENIFIAYKPDDGSGEFSALQSVGMPGIPEEGGLDWNYYDAEWTELSIPANTDIYIKLQSGDETYMRDYLTATLAVELTYSGNGGPTRRRMGVRIYG